MTDENPDDLTLFQRSQPEHMPTDSLIGAWHNAKAEAARATAQERALRELLTKRLFPKPPEKGTVRESIGFGKEMKLVTKLNYTVDREALAAAKAHLPQDVLDSVIKYKPEVNEAGLATLDPRYGNLVTSFITSKPGAPSIEIVDAKKR